MAIDDSTLAKRIRGALEHAEITQVDLARAVGMDNTALSKIFNGKRKISSLELAKIADAVGVSVAALLADRDSPMSFSGRVDVARAPAAETTEFLETLIDLDELLVELGFPGEGMDRRFPLPLPTGGEISQAGILARDVERLLENCHGPYASGVTQLAHAAERRLGVDVALHPFPDGFDGLSVERGPLRLVVVNSAAPRTRQLFTLAHEIGHLAAGDANERITFDSTVGSIVIDEDVYGRRSPEERRANSFASALLMPDRVLKKHVEGKKVDEGLIVVLLTEFGVSFDALVYRLHNVGLIDAATRDRLRSSPVRRSVIRAGRSGSSHVTRAPGNLVRRALDAYDAGRLSARVLADLTGTGLGEMLRQLEPPDFSEDDPEDVGGILGVL